MVFRKVPYCLLPYTISSQPIRPRATRVKLPPLRMILRSMCSAEITVWFAVPILQRNLDSLFTCFKQGKIEINAAKTQAIYFTRCWSPVYDMLSMNQHGYDQGWIGSPNFGGTFFQGAPKKNKKNTDLKKKVIKEEI
jgi:hypothetical protein